MAALKEITTYAKGSRTVKVQPYTFVRWTTELQPPAVSLRLELYSDGQIWLHVGEDVHFEVRRYGETYAQRVAQARTVAAALQLRKAPRRTTWERKGPTR